jgi:glutamyl-Q tRNA(Asp) synthetase
VAAVASYIDARANGGEWIVRMEDVDTPRCVPGADAGILKDLERFGFYWDEAVVYQSQRTEFYRAALERLKCAGLAYPCGCSRREVGEAPYPGTCRERAPDLLKPHSWRARMEDRIVRFEDRLAGPQSQNVASEVGDFVVLRAEGLFAYQLAVVVDDADQEITDIVRGADLLDSTPRQIALQQMLGYPQPLYLHTPVATNAAGEKLSKQTGAPPLNERETGSDLRKALLFLGLDPPAEADAQELLRWAIVSGWPSAMRYPRSGGDPNGEASI